MDFNTLHKYLHTTYAINHYILKYSFLNYESSDFLSSLDNQRSQIAHQSVFISWECYKQ